MDIGDIPRLMKQVSSYPPSLEAQQLALLAEKMSSSAKHSLIFELCSLLQLLVWEVEKGREQLIQVQTTLVDAMRRLSEYNTASSASESLLRNQQKALVQLGHLHARLKTKILRPTGRPLLRAVRDAATEAATAMKEQHELIVCAADTNERSEPCFTVAGATKPRSCRPTSASAACRQRGATDHKLPVGATLALSPPPRESHGRLHRHKAGGGVHAAAFCRACRSERDNAVLGARACGSDARLCESDGPAAAAACGTREGSKPCDAWSGITATSSPWLQRAQYFQVQCQSGAEAAAAASLAFPAYSSSVRISTRVNLEVKTSTPKLGGSRSMQSLSPTASPAPVIRSRKPCR